MLAKYNAALGTAQTTTEKTSQATDGLGTAIAGAITAIGIQQVIAYAEGMQTLGDNVNIAQAQFGALTQGMGSQSAIMDKLRVSTGGVIDNLDLMTSSNQLLKTGVVSSTDELTKFLGGVEKLKPATEDMNSAIMSMSQMLQNQTTRGLNQFGLNVDDVKNRVDQLKASGLSAADAFKQAVFEGMDTEINKLGDAATAAETPLKQLQTQLENIKEVASSNFASGVEGIINAADAASQKLAYNDQLQATMQRLYGMPQGSAIQNLLSGTPTGYTDDQWKTGRKMLDLVNSDLSPAITKYNQLIGDGGAAWRAQSEQIQKTNAAIAEQSKQFQTMWQGGVGAGFSAINNISGVGMAGADGTMPQFLSQGQADAIVDRVNTIKQDAQSMKDAFKDSITADQTSQLDAAVKSANNLATAAQKAADAFKNMTLPSLLGQGSGGISGQVEDQVLAAAKTGGMSDKALAALQNTLDMSNGRQTQAGQAEQKFAAGLVGLPPDVVAKAINNWVATQQAAALAGLPNNTFAGDEYGAAGLVGGGPGQKITIKPGQGMDEIMKQYGLTQAQLQAAGAMMKNGKGVLQGSFNVPGNMQLNPFYNPQATVDQVAGIYQSAGGGAGNAPNDGAALKSNMTDSQMALQRMVNDAQSMSDKFMHMGDILKQISNTPINLRFNVSGLPPWLQPLFASGGVSFGTQMAKATASNGGVPPGASSARPRGGPTVAPN